MRRLVWTRAPAAVTALAAIVLLVSPTPASANANNGYIRDAVADAAAYYLGAPYYYQTGWACSSTAMDCECLNRHAMWDGTYNATGYGLQLYYTLWGQIDGTYTDVTPYTYYNAAYLEKGDLVFWDTDPNDGDAYGGDEDHTGTYVGNGWVIDANAYYGEVEYDTYTLGGAYPNPLFVDYIDAEYPYG